MDVLDQFDECDYGSLLSDALDALRWSLEQLHAPPCEECCGYGEIGGRAARHFTAHDF